MTEDPPLQTVGPADRCQLQQLNLAFCGPFVNFPITATGAYGNDFDIIGSSLTHPSPSLRHHLNLETITRAFSAPPHMITLLPVSHGLIAVHASRILMSAWDPTLCPNLGL